MPAPSRRIEHPGEFSILKIPQFPGDDWPLSGDEQQLAGLRHVADLIGRQKGPADMLLADSYAGGLGIQRPTHGLKDDGFLSEEIGDQAGAIVIVDAEDLEDAGVGKEGPGALAVGGAQLMDVLEDRPE